MPGDSQARPVEENPPFATFDTVPSPGIFETLGPASPGEDVMLELLPFDPSNRSDGGLAQAQHIVRSDMLDRMNELSISTCTARSMQATSSDMNLAVGGTLVPAPLEDLPGITRRDSPRAGPGLRLPSFEMLGIAAPHPNQLTSLNQMSLNGQLNYIANSDSRHYKISPLQSDMAVALTGDATYPALPDADATAVAKRALQSSICHDIDTLTPPVDIGDMPFNMKPVMAMSAPVDSPGTNPHSQLEALTDDKRDEQGVLVPIAGSLSNAGVNDIENTGSKADEATLFHNTPIWIQPAVRKLLQEVQLASAPIDETLKVLSHALPSPSPNGHIFSLIINDLHLALPSDRTEWVNVLHAIPGEYNLQKLPPTSPPATPGPAVGGDDYFTKKAFDTAVTILDYQTDLSVQMPSPNRAVASPSSMHVAIVERYIPPTNVNEFSEMFNPDGPSILVDRLVELSPNNGTLLFIYPNKAGARSFYADHLEPIKAPTLRALATRYNVPMNVGEPLENLDKALLALLPTHDQLTASMHALCARLTASSTSLRNFRHRPCRFVCKHAQTASVTVPLDVWLTDWWSKQEKRKLRSAMQGFAHAASNQRSDPHLGTPPSENILVQQLLSDMARKAERIGLTTAAVEVSVFVVTRDA